MKMNKFFMLGLAGLAFAACSNEEEVGNQFPEGTGAVTIKIVSPALTKSIHDQVTADEEGGNTVAVTGPVVITLTDGESSRSITLTEEQFSVQHAVTFWNVTNPTKVTVAMNGGLPGYEGVKVETFDNVLPKAIPAYGEVGSAGITLTGDTGSPSSAGSVYENGANSGDDKNIFQMYEATVTLAIPVARLEISDITHVTAVGGKHVADDCAYSVLNIGGVYLDNVYAEGNGVSYSNGRFACATGTPTDYSFTGVDDPSKQNYSGTGIIAVLSDAVEEEDFLTVGGTWPEEAEKAYAYNFFGADGIEYLPKFKIYFDESEAKSDPQLPAPRFAMIESYKTTEGTPITKFEPGHIYRILKAELTDNNIVGNEGGETLYGVEVTVVEAAWTIETIDADWVGSN